MERRNDFTRSCIDMGMVRKVRCGQKIAFARSGHIWLLEFIFVCHIWLLVQMSVTNARFKWKPSRPLDNKKNKAAALFVAGLSNPSGLLASYPWAWLMFLGMSIRLSAWGFGVAHGSYSGDEAGDLTGISFEESGSNLMDSLALGIAGPSGKLALLDSLESLVVASGSTVSAMAAGFCCLFGLQLVYI